MELVYLWVEKYKNIHRQGFNFSPRFRCEFKAIYKQDENGNEVLDEQNSELIICDKKDPNCKNREECKKYCDEPYIENFFGDNINVTAIVGKNGSGKSSLLELIKLGIYDEKNGRYFAIIFDHQKEDFLQAGNIAIHSISVETYGNLYNIYNTQSSYYPDITCDYQISQHLLNISEDYLHAKSIEEITKQYSANMPTSWFKIKHYTQSKILQAGIHAFFKDNIKLPQDWQLPKYLFVEIDTKYILQSLSSLIEKLNKNNTDLNIINMLEKIKEILVLSAKPIPKQYQTLQTICVINFILQSYQGSINIFEKEFNNLLTLVQGLEHDKFISGIKSYFEKDFQVDNAKFPYAKDYFQKCQFLLNILNKYITDEIPYICKLELTQNIQDILQLMNLHSSLTITVPNFLTTYLYPDFSTGQKELFNLLAKIYWSIENPIETRKPKDNSTILLLLDEPDSFLHPNWQKQLLINLINFFQINYTNYNFHLIFTTHSPFLLSDIPKQNIIFLDTYKEGDPEVKAGKQKVGNCKVVDGLNDKKETFGANIHTLLSDSFFMDEGLIGEFAKNKIRTMKVAHRYVLHKHKRKTLFTQSCKRCRRLLIKQLPKFWQIQNIIGEPFLQKIVKNQLEEIELILLKKAEAIDNEIARLQSLKASLTND